MFRRTLMKMFGAAALVLPVMLAGSPGRQSFAATSEGEPVRFRWRVPVAHKETVEQSLRYEGTVEPETDKKGVMVFVFVGIVLLPYLAKSVLELMREIEHGGVIVDACGSELEIQTDKRMPHGMVVVRNCKDQDVKVYGDAIDGPSELSGLIEKAMGGK